jgi:hypothetical protein
MHPHGTLKCTHSFAENLEGNSSLEDTSLNLTTIIKWIRWHSIPLAED